jgi:hypothetical protein
MLKSALAIVMLLCPACYAQSVSVRVLDAKHKVGLANETVSVQFVYDKPASVTPPLRLKTDSNGEARFDMPDPRPEHLDVRVALTSEHWHCGCWMMADTETVLEKGLAEAVPSETAASQTTAKPGQILFLPHPFTFIEILLYPLTKG